MHKLEILDHRKPIVLLKWIGIIEKEEAIAITPKLLEVGKQVGGSFYFLVDVSEMKLNNAVDEFSEHQKASLHMIKKIAVVVDSSITKLQLRKMAKNSGNDKETMFNNYEEAYAFLKSQS